jgi:hypothetical protein
MPLNNLIQGAAQKGAQFGKFLQGTAKRQIRGMLPRTQMMPRTQMQPKNFITPAPRTGPMTPSKLPMPHTIKQNQIMK